jgi:hypothetical protein
MRPKFSYFGGLFMKIADLIENVLNIFGKSIEVFLKALLVFGYLAIGRYVVVDSMDYIDYTGWHQHDYVMGFLAGLLYLTFGGVVFVLIWLKFFDNEP